MHNSYASSIRTPKRNSSSGIGGRKTTPGRPAATTPKRAVSPAKLLASGTAPHCWMCGRVCVRHGWVRMPTIMQRRMSTVPITNLTFCSTCSSGMSRPPGNGLTDIVRHCNSSAVARQRTESFVSFLQEYKLLMEVIGGDHEESMYGSSTQNAEDLPASVGLDIVSQLAKCVDEALLAGGLQGNERSLLLEEGARLRMLLQRAERRTALALMGAARRAPKNKADTITPGKVKPKGTPLSSIIQETPAPSPSPPRGPPTRDPSPRRGPAAAASMAADHEYHHIGSASQGTPNGSVPPGAAPQGTKQLPFFYDPQDWDALPFRQANVEKYQNKERQAATDDTSFYNAATTPVQQRVVAGNGDHHSMDSIAKQLPHLLSPDEWLKQSTAAVAKRRVDEMRGRRPAASGRKATPPGRAVGGPSPPPSSRKQHDREEPIAAPPSASVQYSLELEEKIEKAQKRFSEFEKEHFEQKAAWERQREALEAKVEELECQVAQTKDQLVEKEKEVVMLHESQDQLAMHLAALDVPGAVSSHSEAMTAFLTYRVEQLHHAHTIKDRLFMDSTVRIMDHYADVAAACNAIQAEYEEARSAQENQQRMIDVSRRAVMQAWRDSSDLLNNGGGGGDHDLSNVSSVRGGGGGDATHAGDWTTDVAQHMSKLQGPPSTPHHPTTTSRGGAPTQQISNKYLKGSTIDNRSNNTTIF